MSLIKIAEPEDKSYQPSDKFVVGIDLGTTNSLVATVIDGTPKTIPVAKNTDILPSVVHYNGNKDITVGHAAQDKLISEPNNTFFSVKRFLGRENTENSKQSTIRYNIADADKNMCFNANSNITAVQISAEILRTLKLTAEKYSNKKIDGVVVTVPAYFDNIQRKATKDAARIAGLPLLRLINEPTAAAIAYGLNKNDHEIVAIYDLGGGTFDVSILSLENGVFEVIATRGDNNFGGDDIDIMISQWILTKSQIDIKTLDAIAKRQLITISKQAKEKLTTENKIAIEFNNWNGSLDIDTFDKIIEPAIAKTINMLQVALIDANIAVSDITHVILVGGSTKSRHIRKKMQDFCGKKPLDSVDPDRVVAIGAAIHADILSGNNTSNMLLIDVIPLSLGIETMGGIMEKIIDRNSKIPAINSQLFTTYKDGQSSIAVNVYQGDRELVKDNRLLAKFILSDIPAMPAGMAKIEVNFQVDVDGMLSVSASEKSTGKESSIEIKSNYDLTDEDINKMILDSLDNAEQDHQERQLQHAIVESKYLINAVKKLLQQAKDFIKLEFKEQINNLILQLTSACDNRSQKDITTIKQELSTITEKIAKAHIKSVVEGSKLSDFEE